VSSSSASALAVVLPTDRLETVAATLDALRRQTVAHRLEVILVTPSGVAVAEPDPAGDFASVRRVECGDLDQNSWLPRARAAGVRAATAPVVALGETHSFPEPEWAAALLAAHEGPWAAVGARMLNANPGSAISWAGLLIDFGPWVELGERGPMSEMPGHNTSYKREILLARGERLEHDFASETLLAAELIAAGHRLLFEPAAATRHVNLATPYWYLERFDHDRQWAALRAAPWGLPRRLLYALGAPLIPVVRFARMRKALRRTGRATDLRLAAIILLGLAAGAAGEAFAYLSRGSGASGLRLHEVELHRERFTGGTETIP
jgi:hypothetical protein